MSQDLSSTINVISKFLDPKLVENLTFVKDDKVVEIEKIDDILKLPLHAFRFLEPDDAKYLEEFLKIESIEDASKLKNPKVREKIDEKINIIKEKYERVGKGLEKAITISSLISSIKKEAEPLEKEHQKVIVVGLDNAGKTAILTKFGGKLNIAALSNLKPTKGVKREIIESSNLDLLIWDMGGQKQYRNKYFKNPEQYFLQVDLIIYVLDVQDSGRFEESFDYFEKLLDIIIKLEENPYILIFLHKFDPDLKNDSAILLNIEFLKDNLAQLYKNLDYKFEYEIYLTSIYSMISNEPRFSRYIKDVMKSSSLSDPTIKKVEGLGNILEEILNAVIRLSESISLQISSLEHRISALEGGAILAANSGQPIEIQSSTPNIPAENARTKVLTELKDLFAKKKSLDI